MSITVEGSLEDVLTTSNILERVQFNPKHMKKVKEYFAHPEPKRIGIISPVRDSDSEEDVWIRDFIKIAEGYGSKAYYPKDMNFQDDQFNGLIICNTMRYVIENSGQIAIYYNPLSEGSKFDMGMALFFEKMFDFLNHTEKSGGVYTEYNIFAEMNREPGNFSGNVNAARYDLNMKPRSTPSLAIKYDHQTQKEIEQKATAKLDAWTAIKFGMLFASRVPFYIENVDEVQEHVAAEKLANKTKSYSQVALMLHQLYNP